MGLFQRISDIVSANLGEMAEQFEDPAAMLRQAVREMDSSIQTATGETARAMASEKKLVRELAHNESEARQWQARAEKAIEAEDDELARRALVRKQEHERLAVALRDQLVAARDAAQTLRHQLEGMKAKLAEARRNLGTLTARRRAAEVRKNVYLSASETGETGLDDRAFEKFERMRDRVEQAEAEAEALAELQGFATGSRESAGNRSDDDIDAQLQELKRKKRQS